MLIIKSIHIEGIWGYKKINCNFHRNVNILIGKNGIGKTTILNLLSSTINVDTETLHNISFDKLTIDFYDEHDSNSKITFEIKRFMKNERPMISYEFTGIDIPKQNITKESDNIVRYLLKRKINALINLTWLSINRKNIRRYHTNTNEQPEIDKRLEELFAHIQDYYYKLMSRSMELNQQFKSDVINLFLYDKDIDDTPTLATLESIKEENIDKNDLINMFSSLGLSNEAIKTKIETHLEMIEKAKKEILTSETSPLDSTNTLNDSSTKIISLYLRTRGMLNAYHRSQEKTEENYALLNKYLKLLGNFMKDKKFSLSSETDGKLSIEVTDENQNEKYKLNYKDLSSGEKQILILLTEALLQQGKQYIYLADEPEMSLHMNWQAIIIDALIQLNKNAQIIVATHSPEIAQDWNDMIIDLNQL